MGLLIKESDYSYFADVLEGFYLLAKGMLVATISNSSTQVSVCIQASCIQMGKGVSFLYLISLIA